MRGVSATRTCLVLASAFLVSGCSALLMSRPPLGDGPLPEGTCSESVVAPVLDVAMGVLTVVTAVDRANDDEEEDFTNMAFGILAGGGGWAYSAYKGFGWTSECRRRQALSEQAIADHLRTLARNARAPDEQE